MAQRRHVSRLHAFRKHYGPQPYFFSDLLNLEPCRYKNMHDIQNIIYSIQRVGVKGTKVDGNQELPEMKLSTVNFAASVESLIR